MRKPINIVFYNSYEEKIITKKACIFYDDGSVENATFDKGLDATKIIIDELEIKKDDDERFKALIGKERIFLLASEKELEKQFDSFVIDPYMSKKKASEIVDSGLEETRTNEASKEEIKIEEVKEENEENEIKDEPVKEEQEEHKEYVYIHKSFDSLFKELQRLNPDVDLKKDYNLITGKKMIITPVPISELVLPTNFYYNEKNGLTNKHNTENGIYSAYEIEETQDIKDLNKKKIEEEKQKAEEEKKQVEKVSSTETEKKEEVSEDTEILPVIATSGNVAQDVKIKPEEKSKENKKEKKEKGIKAFFKRQFEKIKESKLVKRITQIVVATAVLFGLATTTNGKNKYNSATASAATANMVSDSNDDNIENLNELTKVNHSRERIHGNEEIIKLTTNESFNDYSFAELVDVTTNEAQKRAMVNLDDTIIGFNKGFANAHVEKDKNIRAALKFEEVIALQQAYNDYSESDIKEIFNGADRSSLKLTNNYKMASLQLMGAYAIETRDSKVDMSLLIENEEGKEFYNRYHEMFLSIKEAEGNDKIAKVKEFYDAVKKDFPITEEVRTEGIMHSDDRDLIESYKLSVTPMIAAAEMMYQNLAIDETLEDLEIDFLNDIGLCNYAEDKFDNIIDSVKDSEEDIYNPTYEQYKKAMEKRLNEENINVISDEARELSNLDSFQKAVNKQFYEKYEGINIGYIEGNENSYKEEYSWTKTESKVREVEYRTEKEAPEEEIENRNNDLDEVNKRAEEEGKTAAEENAKEMQEKLDEEAEEIYELIEENDEDMEEKIEENNEKIENGETVNEDDFGDHNVEFDDDNSDDNGNLDDSVEDITTDPSDNKEGETLPNPNDTEEDFEKRNPVEEPAEPEPTPEIIPETEQPVEPEPTPEIIPETEKPINPLPGEGGENPIPVPQDPTIETENQPSNPETGTPSYTEYESDQNEGEIIIIEIDYDGQNSTYEPTPVTNEEIVNQYVESLDGVYEEEAFQYTYGD